MDANVSPHGAMLPATQSPGCPPTENLKLKTENSRFSGRCFVNILCINFQLPVNKKEYICLVPPWNRVHHRSPYYIAKGKQTNGNRRKSALFRAEIV
jgi:hypothetical protein